MTSLRERGNKSRLARRLINVETYRRIVEDEGGGCVNRWCTGVRGRINILASVEL